MVEHSAGRRRDIDALITARTSGWTDADRGALAAAVASLNPSVRHLADILDWIDDIAARDGCPAGGVLDDAELRAIVGVSGGASDRLKRWKERLRRLRYPRLAARETALAGAIAALRLGPEVTVSPPPDLEGGAITVGVCARSSAELAAAVDRLRTALLEGRFDGVFAALTAT